jgi:SAM-dependent methyltransferase
MQERLSITELLKDRSGIRLDIGAGENRQPGFVTMDIRDLPNVDIVWDAQEFPYPLPDNSCLQILMSHLWEHIEPKFRFKLMDELHRILKPRGQLLISAPHAESHGANQDPSHYTSPNETTFLYFNPECPLYAIYKPKPWRVESNVFNMSGNIEVIMSTIKEDI